MSDATLEEMHALVRRTAFPAQPGESVKAAIVRATRRLGLPFGRVRDHWYRRARSVSAHELDLARQRAVDAEVRADIEAAERLLARIEMEDADGRARALVARLAALAAEARGGRVGSGGSPCSSVARLVTP